MTEPEFTCPIVDDGRRCGRPISEHHWACRSCWLRFPRRFLCRANVYRRGTPEYDAMIMRANKLLAADYDELNPPWR
ncbi:MAG TPA: hypothetical protein VJR89_33715 [Polyangiales bacterium]|nr:hypothetical protein [Polyangiales bacterium]